MHSTPYLHFQYLLLCIPFHIFILQNLLPCILLHIFIFSISGSLHSTSYLHFSISTFLHSTSCLHFSQYLLPCIPFHIFIAASLHSTSCLHFSQYLLPCILLHIFFLQYLLPCIPLFCLENKENIKTFSTYGILSARGIGPIYVIIIASLYIAIPREGHQTLSVSVDLLFERALMNAIPSARLPLIQDATLAAAAVVDKCFCPTAFRAVWSVAVMIDKECCVFLADVYCF